MSEDRSVDEHPPYTVKVDGEIMRRDVPTVRLALRLAQDLHKQDQRRRVEVFDNQHIQVFKAQLHG